MKVLDTNFKVLMATMEMQLGGAETHVLELCKGLKAMGVTVFVASNGGSYEAELTENGITHFKAPLHNKKINNVISAYFALKKIIMENDIKLVHAHARIPAFLCGLLQKKLNFRLVTTAHFPFVNIFPYNLLTNWGEKTLAVSLDLKEYLMKKYSTPEKNILLTVNGIDTERFIKERDPSSFLKDFNISLSDIKIMCLTRLDKDPSAILYVLIEAAEELYKAHKNIKIIIVGNGDNYKSIKEKADEMNKKLNAHVIILTGGRTDVCDILPCADVFVGISRAALEAMSAERPVILAGGYGYMGCFNESTLKDAIDTNFTCRGFDKAVKEQLASDIVALLSEDDEIKKSLGKFGRETVKKNYSVERMCNDTLSLYESVRVSQRKTDVMLYGYYGSNNNGDDALLKSIIDDLREASPDINITVLSRKPSETANKHNVNSIYLFNFLKLLKHLKDTKMLVSGGGTLLQDITSTRSLIYYITVMKCAHKRGVRIMLYANGIGPIRLNKNRERIKEALALSDLITLRDSQSYELLKELNTIKNVPAYLTADVVFSLRASNIIPLPELLARHSLTGCKYYVVALRSWKYLREGFEECISTFCDYMNETYRLTAVFVPMQPSDDTKISKKVIGMMKTDGRFISGDVSTDEILGLVENSEFVLSMRLHTIIYAARAAVPCIGIVYDPKVKAMMDIINQDLYVKAEEADAAKLIRFGETTVNHKNEISKQIKEKAEEQVILAKQNLTYAVELLMRKEF